MKGLTNKKLDILTRAIYDEALQAYNQIIASEPYNNQVQELAENHPAILEINGLQKLLNKKEELEQEYVKRRKGLIEEHDELYIKQYHNPQNMKQSVKEWAEDQMDITRPSKSKIEQQLVIQSADGIEGLFEKVLAMFIPEGSDG